MGARPASHLYIYWMETVWIPVRTLTIRIKLITVANFAIHLVRCALAQLLQNVRVANM